MNPKIIQDVAESTSSNISFTTVVLIIFCVGWLLERIYKITNNKKRENNLAASSSPTWSNFRKELDKKVNGDDCKEFRTRIGGESDEHRRNINEIKNDVSEIKSGISYIKGKLEQR